MNLIPLTFPVTCHTSHIGPNSTFVAIKGFKDDGTRYIKQALELGATTIVVDHTSLTPEITALCAQFNATCVSVENTRIALAERASTATGDAWKKLKLIGVTGTKGKTTTTFLTDYLLRSAGYKTALTGSIVQRINHTNTPSSHATPESDYLHQFFAACVAQGIEYVVIEISSHALSLHRVHGLTFNAVAFTNLATDHLDFHTTMDEYFEAKMQLFSMVKPGGFIVINADTEWGPRAEERAKMIAGVEVEVFTEWIPGSLPLDKLGIVPQDDKTFQQLNPLTSQKATNQTSPCHPGARTSCGNPGSIHSIQILSSSFDGITLILDDKKITCPRLFGSFNASNIAMATLLCPPQAQAIANTALLTFPGIPGRLQYHRLTNGAHAFVDYAHNAISMQAVLSMLRLHTQHLIVVFGCGGNKPRERRFGMGTVAGQYTDVIILTDDNPRFEDRMDIINDIISGIPQEQQSKVVCIPDRDKAIRMAASLAQTNSIIALLGKGHQTYYEIQGQNLHFDDFEQIGRF